MRHMRCELSLNKGKKKSASVGSHFLCSTIYGKKLDELLHVTCKGTMNLMKM